MGDFSFEVDLDLEGDFLPREQREREDAVDLFALGNAETFVEEEGSLLPTRRLLGWMGRETHLGSMGRTGWDEEETGSGG